jgi:hypothetical protein
MGNSEYKHGACTTNESVYETLKWTRAIKILQQNEQCRESIAKAAGVLVCNMLF